MTVAQYPGSREWEPVRILTTKINFDHDRVWYVAFTQRSDECRWVPALSTKKECVQ